jgi:hypothetical protein
MILTEMELVNLNKSLNADIEQLRMLCDGLEDFIRRYTNNPFTVRNITYNTPVVDGKLKTQSSLINEDDCVLISNSRYNDGVYVVDSIDGTLDRELFDEPMVNVTLVRYPNAVKMGVMELLKYNVRMADKVGISSESISRHSVSYSGVGTDGIGGYPASMMAFLKPYMKARF